MSTPYAGDPDNTPTTIAIPDDGDDRDAASVGTPLEGCFDYIKHLDRDKAETADFEPDALTLQLASAALDWHRPGASITACTVIAGAWCPVSDTGANGAFFAVGGADHHVFKSSDGQQWSLDDDLDVTLGTPDDLFAIAASTVDDTLIALGAGLVSTSACIRIAGTWTENTELVTGESYAAIAYSEIDDHFVVVGQDNTSGDFVCSITYDEGTGWDDGKAVASAYDPPTMLAISPAGVCVAMSDASPNYFRSANGGESWAEVAGTAIPGISDPRALACDRFTGRFWVVDDVGGCFSSADGLTWTAHTSCPVAPGGPTSLAVHRSVLVLTAGASFQTRVSVNGGAWSSLQGPTVAAPGFVAYGGGRFWQGGASGANGVGSASHAAMLIGGF